MYGLPKEASKPGGKVASLCSRAADGEKWVSCWVRASFRSYRGGVQNAQSGVPQRYLTQVRRPSSTLKGSGSAHRRL